MTFATEVNLTFMLVSFLFGVILAVTSIIIGNNTLKVIVFLLGFIPIFAALMGYIPIGSPNFNATMQQTVDRVTDFLMFFVNVVVPYLIGVIISNAGSGLIEDLAGQRQRRRKKYY